MNSFVFFKVLLFVGAALYIEAGAQNPYDNTGKEDKYKEIDAWEPPAGFKDDYPYYLAGYDFQGRPVWNYQYWKWNLHKLLDSNETVIQNYDKYFEQFLWRVHNSPKYVPKQDSEENLNVDGWAMIVNMDGFDLTQLVNFKSLKLLFKMMAVFETAAANMDYGFVVNTNFFAERFTNTLKPVLGKTLAKVNIRGTQKVKWLPEVLRAIPKTSLPEDFGGFRNFTPVAYGR